MIFVYGAPLPCHYPWINPLNIFCWTILLWQVLKAKERIAQWMTSSLSLSPPLSLAFNSSLSLDSQRKTLGLYFWDASKHINNYAMLRPILITSPGCCSCPFSISRGNQWEKKRTKRTLPKKKTTRRSIDRISWLKLADEFCLKDLVKEKLSLSFSLSYRFSFWLHKSVRVLSLWHYFD